MPFTTEVSARERANMHLLSKAGLSQRAIATQLGRSKNTVERVLNAAARDRDRDAIYRKRMRLRRVSALGAGTKLSPAQRRRRTRDDMLDREELIMNLTEIPGYLDELGIDDPGELEYMSNAELAELGA